MARAATELLRDVATPLVFDHSRRVFLFGALRGQGQGVHYDPELPYVGAMFHSRYLIEALDGVTAERGQVLTDPFLDLGDVSLDRLHSGNHLGQQEAMVVGEAPGQGLLELGGFAAHRPPG